MAYVPKITQVDFLCDDEVIVCFTDGKLARLSAEEVYPKAMEESDLIAPEDEADVD